jgi:hypothetical protein
MPWKIYKEGEEWCVYKHGPDGAKMGESMGCHPSEAEAQKQIMALHANVKEAHDPKPAQTAILVEQLEIIEDTLNVDKKQVDVVLIRPGWSKNNRYYGIPVLAKAVSLFEGIKAYANHPTPEQIVKGIARDVRDITGDYTNVRLGLQGEIRATRSVYGPAGEAVWPLIMRAIETKRPIVGISINAVGKAMQGNAEGRDGLIVEDITHANSADDVDAPAAGGSYESIIAQDDTPTLVRQIFDTLSYEEFIAARPDYLERVREQMKRVRQDDAVRAATSERDQLQEELVKAQADIKRLKKHQDRHRVELDRAHQDTARAALLVTLEQALREARLPASYEHDLRQRLPQVDPATWPDIIAVERRKAQGAGAKVTVPVDGAPRLEEAAVPSSVPDRVRPILPDENFDEWFQRVYGRPAGRG